MSARYGNIGIRRRSKIAIVIRRTLKIVFFLTSNFLIYSTPNDAVTANPIGIIAPK